MRDTAESVEGFVARLLGMKRREIIDVAEIADGLVVTTHDGQHALVTAEQTISAWTGEIPVATPAEVDEKPVDDDQGEHEEPHIRFDLAAVPDGPASEVLAWVDNEPDRARRALEVEQGRDRPRAGLGAQLEKIAHPEKVVQG